MASLPLQFLLLTIAGWMTRDQQKVVAYLLAENEVLRAQIRGKRIRFSDAQRRKLARAAKELGRRELSKLSTLVTPETLLRWYRRLIAQKYDGSGKRGIRGRAARPTSWRSSCASRARTRAGATREFEAP